MAYEILKDGYTLVKAISETKNPATGEVVYDHVPSVKFQGEVVADDDVSPVLIKLLEAGDPHVTSMLRYTDAEPTTRGGTALEHVMGPESGSPGVIKPAEAAELAEKQAYANEADRPLAAGLSEEAEAALAEEGFTPESAMGRTSAAETFGTTGRGVEAGMSVAEAAAVTNAGAEPVGDRVNNASPLAPEEAQPKEGKAPEVAASGGQARTAPAAKPGSGSKRTSASSSKGSGSKKSK